MTNLGFHRLMGERGIRVSTTDVGDRYVLEALRSHGGVLGEQSGHIIYLRDHVTGTASPQRSSLRCAQGSNLARGGRRHAPLPQAQENVPVSTRELPPSVLAEVERLNRELGERGRSSVRPSGTEPVVRVLTEAEDAAEAEELCVSICRLFYESLTPTSDAGGGENRAF